MLGAVIGDIIGGYYSSNPTMSREPELFVKNAEYTQNILLAAGLCDFLNYSPEIPKGRIEKKLYSRELAGIVKKYALHDVERLDRSVRIWAKHGTMTKSSVGSASAAVAALPFAYVCESYEQAAAQAELACGYVYNTDSSRAAARAVVTAVFLLLRGAERDEVGTICSSVSGIDLNPENLEFSVCREAMIADTSPEAVIKTAFSVFYSSEKFSDTMRKACTCAEFSHITAAVSGAMNEAERKRVPERMKEFALERTDIQNKPPLKKFIEKYCRFENKA